MQTSRYRFLCCFAGVGLPNAFHDSSLMLSNFSIYRYTTATVNNWD